jgi:hypothetical protein
MMKHSVPMTHPVLARLGQVEWISRAINSSMGGDFDDGKTFIPPVLYKSVCIIHSKSVTSPPRMHVRPGREGFLCLPCSNVMGCILPLVRSPNGSRGSRYDDFCRVG